MQRNLPKILLFLLILCFALTSCAGTLVSLKQTDDGYFVNKRLDLSYEVAPLPYLSASIGEEYAFCSDEDLTLYTVNGYKTSECLTDEYNTVYFTTEKPLPDLAGFNPYTVHVCYGSEKLLSLVTLNTSQDVKRIVSMYENGEKMGLDLLLATEKYTLMFESKDYPSLYYTLLYVEFEEEYYLYDRYSGIAAALDSTIHDILP